MQIGRLNIVGIGPGNDAHITPAVLQAIREADLVIGYATYIGLVKHHLVGKQVTQTGMTEEVSRAQAAIDAAKEGKIVTLISSGDAGVYGMAGLVFEVLRQIGWKRGDSPEIKMIPGITADSSCASLIGAPLIHDTARISLSDLLTPWSVIENRLECAAKGNFVITLYNPASGRRQRQIVEASKIIKRHRSGTTPVALVKSAYRKQQNVRLSDLDHFLDYEIGMNTTVIVGSSNTFVYEDFMITPRGYTNKYSLKDSSLKKDRKRIFSSFYGRFTKRSKSSGQRKSPFELKHHENSRSLRQKIHYGYGFLRNQSRGIFKPTFANPRTGYEKNFYGDGFFKKRVSLHRTVRRSDSS